MSRRDRLVGLRLLYCGPGKLAPALLPSGVSWASVLPSGVRPLGWLARQEHRIIELMFDPRSGRLRGRLKVWVDVTCVVDDARSRAQRGSTPHGYDMSLIVPGLLVM